MKSLRCYEKAWQSCGEYLGATAKLGSKIVKPRPKHGCGSAEDPNAETQTAVDLLEVSPLLYHSQESD